MNRINLLKPAVRQEMKARLMLFGPAGSGKTRTALMIATTLAGESGKVALIDTEVDSSCTYADDFDFQYIPWEPPYDPVSLGETVHALGSQGYITVVDSLSHFWQGEGGILDTVDKKFGNWKEATPLQEEMVRHLLRAPGHVILCARSKQVYSISENGRHVEKLGLAPIQREGFDYELNVTLKLDMAHNLDVDKTRSSVLTAGRRFRPGRGPVEFAEEYGAWLDNGEPVASPEVVAGFLERMNALPDGLRKGCKSDFLTTLARPELLREAQVDQAETLIAEYEAAATVDEATAEDVELTDVTEDNLESLLLDAARSTGDQP